MLKAESQPDADAEIVESRKQHEAGGVARPPRVRGGVVPADLGQAAHEAILKDFRDTLPKLSAKLKRRGIPGVFLDLEPHVKGGGQFGGFSGPDGLGVALRGLCRVLDYADIEYHIRDFEDIRAARGF